MSVLSDLFGLLTGDDGGAAASGPAPALAGVVQWCDSSSGEVKAQPSEDRPSHELSSTPLVGVAAFLVKSDTRPVGDADPASFGDRYAALAGLTKAATSSPSDANGAFRIEPVPGGDGTYWLGFDGHACFALRYEQHRLKDGTAVWRRWVALDRARFFWQLRLQNGRWQLNDDRAGKETWVGVEGFVFHCLRVLPLGNLPEGAVGTYPDPQHPRYGLYASTDGSAQLVPQAETPESRRVPPLLEIPSTELPAGTMDVDLLARTWVRRNITLASLVYGQRGKKGALQKVLCRYVPIPKASLLDKLVVLSDLIGEVTITRGFVPPAQAAVQTVTSGAVDTTGWLERHAYGDAVDIAVGSTFQKLQYLEIAGCVGFDVVRFEGSSLHLDDRGYRLLTVVFEAPGKRRPDWSQFDEVSALQTALGEIGTLLHVVPRQLAGSGADKAEVVLWAGPYYNQMCYPSMTPTPQQVDQAKRIKDSGCGPTSQRTQLEHFGEHPTGADHASVFRLGSISSRTFVLDDHVDHVRVHYPYNHGSPVSDLLAEGNRLVQGAPANLELAWSYTRAHSADTGDDDADTKVLPAEMVCVGGRLDAKGNPESDYAREFFASQTLDPLGVVREGIKAGPVQILLRPPLSDHTSGLGQERGDEAHAGPPNTGGCNHYVLIVGWARITTGATTREYIVLDDSGTYAGRLLLHSAEAILASWTHRGAKFWASGGSHGALVFANAVYIRKLDPAGAGAVSIAAAVGPKTSAAAADVKAVQGRLVELGFQVGANGADGVFTAAQAETKKKGKKTVTTYPPESGYTTEAAIRRFQYASFGAGAVTGEVAPASATLERLNAADALRLVATSAPRLTYANTLQNRFHPRFAKLLNDLGAWADTQNVDIAVTAGSEGFPGDGRHTGKAAAHYAGCAATLSAGVNADALKTQLGGLADRYWDVQFSANGDGTLTVRVA